MTDSDSMIDRMGQEMCLCVLGEPPFDSSEFRKNKWRTIARAALRAMREPTNAMCNAGTRSLAVDWNITADGRVAPEIWAIMIDAALAEKP